MNAKKIKCHKKVMVFGIVIILALLATVRAEKKPEPKVEIVQPKANEVLTGEINVKLKLPPKLSGPVYVGLGGAPWAELEQVGESNEWRGQLNSRMVPNGAQKLIVETTKRRADSTINVTVKNPLNIYFSDLHSHTGYSDGTLVPRVAHDYARKVSKLDVFVLTDHLEQVDEAEWLDTRQTAWNACEDGQFVSFPGLEWTKRIGHMNIYDPTTKRWPTELAAMYKAAADAGVVCKFNHPGTGEDVFNGMAYSEVGDRTVQLMEVRRDKEEQAYILALNNGWHIAPDGSDDTHGSNWGSRFAWSGILAPALTKRNILDALKKRHCYSTLDRNCTLRFKVNEAVMGDIVAETVESVKVMVAVNDPDADDIITRIELFEDGTVIQTDGPNSNHRQWKTMFTPKPGDHYYFVKITQADGNMMWSAPVWVKVGKS